MYQPALESVEKEVKLLLQPEILGFLVQGKGWRVGGSRGVPLIKGTRSDSVQRQAMFDFDPIINGLTVKYRSSAGTTISVR